MEVITHVNDEALRVPLFTCAVTFEVIAHVGDVSHRIPFLGLYQV